MVVDTTYSKMEKLYLCQFCNKRFVHKNNFIYNYHKQKMKPKCNECSKCLKMFCKWKEVELHESQHLPKKQEWKCIFNH